MIFIESCATNLTNGSLRVTHQTMKAGPFITTVATAYRIEEKTVRLVARFLREAGYLTHGASGRGAPHMTARDAAALTIALLATSYPARSVQEFEYYMNLRPDEGTKKFETKNLNEMNLVEFVTLLFSDETELPDTCRLAVHCHLSNAIWEDLSGNGKILYRPDDYLNSDGSANRSSRVFNFKSGLQEERAISSYCINEIKEKAFPATLTE